ncbi:stem 31 kDa glycoprotein-like [Triticum urartu]|nr:stem 31 kDa glycoprotein-like [Triticum urartu]
MAMARMPILVAVALVAAVASCSAWEPNICRPMAEVAATAVDDAVVPLIHALRPLLGSGGQLGSHGGVPCDSWRLGVEAYNVRDWKTVPANCEGYVGHYMLSSHYRRDSKVVIDQAITYLDSLRLAGNGNEDIASMHATSYAREHVTDASLDADGDEESGQPTRGRTNRRGVRDDEVVAGVVSAKDEIEARVDVDGAGDADRSIDWKTKKNTDQLLAVGIKPVFLTGRTEDQRAITVANLRRQGISAWMNLLLKQPGFKGSAVTYKSGERQQLQDAGYVIVGNIGDQWSDILGAPEGARTFKLPDPMYYIG